MCIIPNQPLNIIQILTLSRYELHDYQTLV